MKKHIFTVLLVGFWGINSFAQDVSSEVRQALRKFEGVYSLVATQSLKPSEGRSCYEQILVTQPENSGNCESCTSVELEVIGLPLGQGNIVVQMTGLNQGLQKRVIENPMTSTVVAIVESRAEVTENQIHSSIIQKNLSGVIQHSTEFQGELVKSDELLLKARYFRAINGYEDSTQICHYQRNK